MGISGNLGSAAGGMACSSVTPGNTTARQLVSTPTPCTRVFLFAPRGSTNAADVLFGDANRQADYIANDGSRDRYIHIDDASKIYIKMVDAADSIEYRIEN